MKFYYNPISLIRCEDVYGFSQIQPCFISHCYIFDENGGGGHGVLMVLMRGDRGVENPFIIHHPSSLILFPQSRSSSWQARERRGLVQGP